MLHLILSCPSNTSRWRWSALGGNWVARVNRPEMASDLEALRLSVQQRRALGRNSGWCV